MNIQATGFSFSLHFFVSGLSATGYIVCASKTRVQVGDYRLQSLSSLATVFLKTQRIVLWTVLRSQPVQVDQKTTELK